MRRAALDAYAHQDVPFQKLVDALGVERTLGHSPVFQASFVCDGGGDAAPVGHDDSAERWPATPGERPAGSSSCTGRARADFELREWRGVVGAASYSTELFDHETAARFIAEYRRLLDALLAEPDAPISAPPSVDEAERTAGRRHLERHRGRRAASPRSTACSRRRPRATPDALALVFGAQRLTFAELNARANRLARRLVALGVGPESIVALALERSAEMVVALLAVAKAGGAFLPVDPAYPGRASEVDAGGFRPPASSSPPPRSPPTSRATDADSRRRSDEIARADRGGG